MPSFIDEIIGKLFPQKKTPISIKENFVQSEASKADTERWSQSDEGKEILALVFKNYHYKLSGINGSPSIHILKSPYANGFAISYELPFDEKTFSMLFFAFGRRMLDLGYNQVSLDRKIEEINDDVRTIEKLYFKPPLSSADLIEQKIDQLYGNISVEKQSINDKPSFLKVLVTIYADHLYQKARPFDLFIDDLFQS